MRGVPVGRAAHLSTPVPTLHKRIVECLPGLSLAAIIAAAAHFSAEHLGGQSSIHALIFGLFLGFLAREPTCSAGLDFAGRGVLRISIALLGLQISLATLASLGPAVLFSVPLIVALSIALGVMIGKIFGFEAPHAILAACATSICGASAALAVAAVFADDTRLRNSRCLIVATIALFSTGAMLSYSPVLQALGFDHRAIGFVLGASIHDVAQVVSAGYAVSDEAGEVATLVKLVRIACLLPTVALLSLWLRRRGGAKARISETPPLPVFMLVFASLLVLNSLLDLPQFIGAAARTLSHWSMVIAIAALGVQTSMRQMIVAGGRLVALLAVQSVILLGMTLGAVLLMGF